MHNFFLLKMENLTVQHRLNTKRKSMKENKIHKWEVLLKLVGKLKCVHIRLQRILTSLISNGNLRRSHVLCLRVLRSGDFQQPVR